MENVKNLILKTVNIDTNVTDNDSLIIDRLCCKMSLFYNFSKEIKDISFKVTVDTKDESRLFTITSNYTFEYVGEIENNEDLANKLSIFIKPKLEQLISYTGVEIGIKE